MQNSLITNDIQKTIYLLALELIHFETIEANHAWKKSSGGPYSKTCKNIPSNARYIELKMENYTDYFRPKSNNNWCKMLNEHCFHQWLSPEGWITLKESNCTPVSVYLGGSSLDFMPYFPEDNRRSLPFWGCIGDGLGGNCDHKAGCNGDDWGKSFTLHYAQGILNQNASHQNRTI